jgi:hypothetical protein
MRVLYRAFCNDVLRVSENILVKGVIKMKYTIGEICETLDILTAYENRLRDWNANSTLNNNDAETLAALLSDYFDLLSGIKVDI